VFGLPWEEGEGEGAKRSEKKREERVGLCSLNPHPNPLPEGEGLDETTVVGGFHAIIQSNRAGWSVNGFACRSGYGTRRRVRDSSKQDHASNRARTAFCRRRDESRSDTCCRANSGKRWQCFRRNRRRTSRAGNR